MKKCPYCAEDIQDDAIKCRYCGEWLDKVEPVISEPDKIEPEKIETVVAEVVEAPVRVEKKVKKQPPLAQTTHKSGVESDQKHGISTSEPKYINAGVVGRTGAFIIDVMLCLIVGVIIEKLVGGFLGTIIAVIPICLYFSLLESSNKQATPGKIALGLIVADLNGNRISFIRAFSRFWLKFGHLTIVMFIIGSIKIYLDRNVYYSSGGDAFLFGVFKGIYPMLLMSTLIISIWRSKKKQAIHDMLAETLVIKKGVEGSLQLSFPGSSAKSNGRPISKIKMFLIPALILILLPLLTIAFVYYDKYGNYSTQKEEKIDWDAIEKFIRAREEAVSDDRIHGLLNAEKSDYLRELDLLNKRGTDSYKSGHYFRAIEDFNEAIRIDPKFANSYTNRGLVYLSLDNENSACNDWRKACELANCEVLNWAKKENYCK